MQCGMLVWECILAFSSLSGSLVQYGQDMFYSEDIRRGLLRIVRSRSAMRSLWSTICNHNRLVSHPCTMLQAHPMM